MLSIQFPLDIYRRYTEVVEYQNPEFRGEMHAKDVYLRIMKVQLVFKAIRLREITKVERTE